MKVGPKITHDFSRIAKEMGYRNEQEMFMLLHVECHQSIDAIAERLDTYGFYPSARTIHRKLKNLNIPIQHHIEESARYEPVCN